MAKVIFKRCRMNTGRLRHLFRIWGVWGLYFTIRAMVGRRDHGRRKILLKRIDFWNEKVFLDLADWDLCWRMQKAGMVCCMTEKVVLHHSVGNGEKKVGPIKLRVGQPFREYYQTRDALYLLQENYVPLKMRLRLIANVTIRPVVHYLMLDDKKSRMKFIRRGINDYKKGVHGEYGHQR